MKYTFMLSIAFCLAIISSIMTALGMTELFSNAGTLILILFVIIDLGRFLLFNFIVDEWSNLRSIKYCVLFILVLLFMYSAVGVYSKLDSLVSNTTRQAMIDAAAYNKKAMNAELTQSQSIDFASIARKEYDTAISWNKVDYENCLKRANNDLNKENACNNTKRRLDKVALQTLQETLTKTKDENIVSETTTQELSKNTSNIASILTVICSITQDNCSSYGSLQNSLTILIFLVIVGTDYLQIAIILAVNTRRNKKVKKSYTQAEEKKVDEKETVVCDMVVNNIEQKEIISDKIIENGEKKVKKTFKSMNKMPLLFSPRPRSK